VNGVVIVVVVNGRIMERIEHGNRLGYYLVRTAR
jgi:hypothetical protein